MKSDLPKVLHPVANRPMISHLLDALSSVSPERIVVVVGPGMDTVADAVAPAETAVQSEPLGTGHAVLAARGAIGARDWKTARAALSAYAGTGASETPTQRICELMAEIEEGEFGDRGAARGWLARALHAPEDPQWTGSGYRSHRWSPINPVTGEFDGLRWSVSASVPPASLAAAEGALPGAGGVSEAPEGAAPEAGGVEEKENEVLVLRPQLPDDPGTDDNGEGETGDVRGQSKW